MWDALDRPGLSMLTGDGPERQGIADAMHAAWISFARTGDPGWPAYDARSAGDAGASTRCPRSLDDPMGAQRELWDSVE